jgi:putative DNA primase/helicase
MNNAPTEFLSAIRNAGLNPPEIIEADGRLHRFASNGTPHDHAGWYVFHGDGIPAGAFGDWRTGESQTWCSDIGRKLSPAEEVTHRQKVNAMRRMREEEEARRQADAASKANVIWEEAEGASDEYPYLQAKTVKPYGLRTYAGDLTIGGMACDGALIVPIKIGKVLHSLQFIAPNGEKRFLPGGRVRGCYYSIGVAEGLKRHSVLCIAEGFATAASIHEATGYGVIAAFNAGNLEPVAATMARLREQYPQVRFIVCADDDAWTANNPGLTKATEAAKAIDGLLALPNFAETRPEGATDFNDLARIQGPEAVRRCLETALSPRLRVEPVAALDVEPVSLDTPLLPALPVDSFPGWFRDMVTAVSESTETPIELAALQGIAVLSACIQRTFIIQVNPGYSEPLSLWTLTALESGNRKSTVMHTMVSPLMEYERQRAEAVKAEITKIQSERESIESRIEDLRSKGARGNLKDFEDTKREIQNLEASLPELPAVPRLWAQDITPEKIGQVMAENHERIALFSDEAGLFDIMGGRYSSGVANLDIFLQAHSGFSYRVDRGSRLPITMKHPALAIGISPQPSVLRAMGENKVFRGRGLLARFLYALPTSLLGKRTFSRAPLSPAVSARYAANIHALLSLQPPYAEDGQQGQYTLLFERQAAAELREFSLHVESMLRDGGRYEHIKDWAGKLPGAAARIAGVLHCALHAHGQPWTVPVSLSTVKEVVALAVVLGQHALAAFDLMGTDADVEDARRILRWFEQRRQPTFTEAECFQSLRGHFKKMVYFSPAMKILEERYIVFRETSKPGEPGRVGRPSSPIFTVNSHITRGWQ